MRFTSSFRQIDGSTGKVDLATESAGSFGLTKMLQTALCSEEIEKLLKSGVDIIADRYAFSGVAYSAAKVSVSRRRDSPNLACRQATFVYPKGLDMSWCKAPDQGLPKPDVVFYLSVDKADIAKREGFGGERYETEEMQGKVADIFAALKDETWEVSSGNSCFIPGAQFLTLSLALFCTSCCSNG